VGPKHENGIARVPPVKRSEKGCGDRNGPEKDEKIK